MRIKTKVNYQGRIMGGVCGFQTRYKKNNKVSVASCQSFCLIVVLEYAMLFARLASLLV
jgi:hypothetical protein